MYGVDDCIYDGSFYNQLYSARCSDIAFYAGLADTIDGEICDACCGIGRLTVPIAMKGHKIIGFDNSKSMIEQAKIHSKNNKVSIEFLECDITNLQFNNSFNLMICAHNSFQDVYENDSIHMMFQGINNSLKSAGYLAFDVFNPSPLFMVDQSRHLKTTPNQCDGFEIFETNKYFSADQILRTRWEIYIDGMKEKDCIFDSRCYFPKEIDMILKLHGFQIENRWGDFKGNKFQEQSLKQVILAKKV